MFVAISAFSLAGFAQRNCVSYSPQIINCFDGSEQCQASLENPGQSGPYNMAPIYVHCCDSNLPTYYVAGQCTGLLAQPNAQTQLSRAATTAPLLIANCTGIYLPFTGSIANNWKPDPRRLIKGDFEF